MPDSRKQPDIIPATTLKQLYRNLQVTNGLVGDNLKYYVNLHDEQIRDLENKILLSFRPDDTFFLAGQTGSGKTTAIDYLFSTSAPIKEEYLALYVDFRDETNIDEMCIRDRHTGSLAARFDSGSHLCADGLAVRGFRSIPHRNAHGAPLRTYPCLLYTSRCV